VRLHEDWLSPGFDRNALAPLTGPFPKPDFLRTWWETRGSGTLLIAETSAALMPLFDDGVVRFCGEPDLTDYHSPLGDSLSDLVAGLADELSGRQFQFDSLPSEAAEPLTEALVTAGAEVSMHPHEAAAVLTLPANTEAWHGQLSKRHRHEVRRKRRRFVEGFGEPELVRTPDGFDQFVAMHRSAPGQKGDFFAERGIAEFFSELVTRAGAVIDVLTGSDGTPLAGVIGFEDDDAYFLYNSAYDSGMAAASPGVVLLATLIEHQIERGATVVDFMKGDEPYKFNLGAAPRPLYELSGTFG
jgi:CelD/BcsL family acetyltransferase involved in cellulose biosynthesis